MHIAIIEAGAVGGYFGGVLAHGGEDITIIARGAMLEAIRRQGLHIDDVKGEFDVHPPATDDPKSVGFVDAVLLAVGGWEVPAAIETVRPMMGPNTVVIPLMDGIEAPDQLAATFGKDRVIGGLAVMYGWVQSPGHIRNALPDSSISIGELNGDRNAQIGRLQNAFERAGVTTKIVPNIEASRWQKLIMVGPWSGIAALTRAPLWVIRSTPETRELLRGAMREVATVAQAQGAVLPRDSVEQAYAWLEHMPPTAMGNMQGILNGHPTELETEVGVIVRLGQKLGVDVPRHAFLYAALLPQERQARGEINFRSDA
jgi:2-dehydropantoate 2-reductase